MYSAARTYAATAGSLDPPAPSTKLAVLTLRGRCAASAAGGWLNLAARVEFAIAPNTATPTALPIDRENMFVPLTTPRRLQPTTDCTATITGVEVSPSPVPTTNVATATAQTGEDLASAASSRVPPISTAEPARAVSRNPIRTYSRPLKPDASGHPTDMVAKVNPASTAPVPCTPCT